MTCDGAKASPGNGAEVEAGDSAKANDSAKTGKLRPAMTGGWGGMTGR